ncbi:FtsX-like permease family protein [Mesorhizobium sp. Z1-4]|uniref:ABC transporter permease n=1 Tax=Mesorhizobium sp. Z1-4 TaxID=2448478 RepID=UPI000FD950A4|nr:FtsX-like permease family protein [Mesorhizobium sp. Z1-4]
MRAINRKLLREIWKHRGQMLSIAALVAVGVMTVLTLRGSYESLALSRDLYYRDARFPQIWAQLKRAPERLRRDIENIPGVAAVETRVTLTATLDMPDLDVPALGRFVSIPDRRTPMLGDIHIKSGRYISARHRTEVLVSDKFAKANRLHFGDTFKAIINGSQRDLAVVGTAISPEHAYPVPPGSIFPEDHRYGIVWMSRTVLASAHDMEGAFNEVVLSLAPGVRHEMVIERLDRLLEPYGGLGAYGRADQPSHLILNNELESNRTMGTVIPAVFLGIAAFLLNLVLGRMISIQRTEIAVLKAFGYSNAEVGGHFFRFAMAAVLAGAAIGVGAGVWLGRAMIDLYGVYFDFPRLRYELSWSLVIVAAGVSMAAAAAGALGAVRRAVSLPPAEAMRPEPPATFRAGLFERLGLGRMLPAAGRMILRNMERQPMRGVVSTIGISFAVAILVIGMFMFDGVAYMMDIQFRVAQREDLALSFSRPVSEKARYDLAHLDGVTRVEPYRVVPVRLRSGHIDKELAITGLEQGSKLRQIVTTGGGRQPLPPEGLMVSEILAGQLGLAAGDGVDVEMLEGKRHTARIPVAGVVEDFVGVAAYMDIDALQRLTGGPRTITGAYLSVDEEERAALNKRLKSLPGVSGVVSPGETLASFEKQMADQLFISVFFILGFSSVIAVAVIYNGARVALSERGRELASLRVLGFTRTEVAVLLLGEQGVTTLAAIPLGWLLGYWMAAGVVAGLQSETYRIPLVVSTTTYFWAAVITIAAALASGWIVRRRLDSMDLVEVLKTRE